MSLDYENVRIAVALRTARAALGWNQQEFADKMQVAKSTIARIETVETAPKADFLTRAMRLFRESGVTVDLIYDSDITVAIKPEAIGVATGRLEDELLRRSDRKSTSASAVPNQRVSSKVPAQKVSSKKVAPKVSSKKDDFKEIGKRTGGK